ARERRRLCTRPYRWSAKGLESRAPPRLPSRPPLNANDTSSTAKSHSGRVAAGRARAAIPVLEARRLAARHGSVRVRRPPAAHLLSDRLHRLVPVCHAGWSVGG